VPDISTFNFPSSLDEAFRGKSIFTNKMDEAPPSTPPFVGNFIPPQGQFIASNTFLTFDVIDPDGFRLVLLTASFPSMNIYEVIHDGEAFGPNYNDGNSGRVAIEDGFHFSILRKGGWPTSPTIVPFVIDVFGTENP